MDWANCKTKLIINQNSNYNEKNINGFKFDPLRSIRIRSN